MITLQSILTDAVTTAPVVVSYGMGVDSTAMLVGLARRKERPDLILFADTGSEKPETYAYLTVMQHYLQAVKFPPVIVVRYKPRHGLYESLEGNCLINSTLPSLAFGRKACSLKWKRQPQDAFVDRWEPAQACWKRGEKVVKLIGYDAGPKDLRRGNHIDKNDTKYTYRYPLQEWKWDRERCIEEIAREALPVPMKSSCFFCPASKPDEIEWLMKHHPFIAERIPNLEANAFHNLVSIDGLWRKSTRKRSGSMTEYMQSCGP